MLKNMSKEVFKENINTKFQVKLNEVESVELKLTNITEKKTLHAEFLSLIFEGTDNKILGDNTYTFEHDKLGTFNLFISPYMHKGDMIYYDVVISKLIGNEEQS